MKDVQDLNMRSAVSDQWHTNRFYSILRDSKGTWPVWKTGNALRLWNIPLLIQVVEMSRYGFQIDKKWKLFLHIFTFSFVIFHFADSSLLPFILSRHWHYRHDFSTQELKLMFNRSFCMPICGILSLHLRQTNASKVCAF